MTRGNSSDLQPFDPEIDRTFHRLVRYHLVPFEHPEHSVIGDFEHSDFEYSENMAHISKGLSSFFRRSGKGLAILPCSKVHHELG